MVRWLKRIALALLVLAIVLVATAAVVAWRAGRTPEWYAVAVDKTPPDEVADGVENRRFVPLQNWLARTSTGDLAAKSDAEKTHTLELTGAEINAVLAKYLDHQRGNAETFRVRLSANAIETAFTWTDYARTATVTADVGHGVDGRPTLALGPIRLGEQTAPAWLVARVAAGPADRLRAELDRLHRTGRPPRIDEHDAASTNTMKAVYGRVLLDVIAGRAVSPTALLPANRQGDDWVATRVTELAVSTDTLRVTFRMLTPTERAALLAELNGPLPAP